MLSKFHSRKYHLALLSSISLGILLWFGKIDDSLYVTALLGTVGGYLVANVVESGKGP